MKWTTILLALALAACGAGPLTLSDTPPASTYQTPAATDEPLARPGATAQIRGTVTP